ncbi:MAG: 50S ribosomal protein L10 [Calditrichae bacterium]|nr:50S ribosomal protein L10 [Calditrichota bacterium]MCB9059644.1 50S ribosomal protein L10 [Calditrichia bacterium]
MPTPQKLEIIDKYTEKFKDAKCVYIADYSGIDVATVTDIRKKFRDQNIEYKVLKNRLAKISLNNAGINDLDSYLNGVNTFVIGYDDPVAPAKIFEDFNKKKEILKLKVVLFEGKVFEAEQAKEIAKLPTREVLLSQLVGMLQSPMTKLAATLNAPMQKMAGVLNALKDKKA